MTPEQLQQFNEMYALFKALQNSNSIPLEVDNAFRARFANSLGLTTSSKTASSENKSVNESGSSTYNVLNPPDIFLKVTINGTTYNLPAFT